MFRLALSLFLMTPHLIPATLGVWLLCTAPSLGAIPQQINFHVRLTDASNNPLTGSYDMTFRITSASDGTGELWTEIHTGGNQVAVTNAFIPRP